MVMNPGSNVKITKVKAYSSADTAAIESDVIDMLGYESVLFFCAVHTSDAGNFMKAQQGAVASLSDANDLLGTKITPGIDAEVVVLEIHKPLKRYLRAHVTRGASTAVGEIYAMQFGGRKPPEDNEVGAKNLTPKELGLLKMWIDQGAHGEVKSGSASIR